MPEIVRFEKVTKVFGRNVALNSLSLSIQPAQIVGLIGTNGSGKSTLLRHIMGINLPSKGECFTFGKPARKLTSGDLARIGMVHQHEDYMSWMRVHELLSYVSAFHDSWSRPMQLRLMDAFELHPQARVDQLSPGNRQRLSVILATCHSPELLLLDEPLSDLDPIAREKILMMILEVFRERSPTIVISSHLLHDIERIINHIVCIDAGKLVMDESLDKLKERFAEWTVRSLNGRLPARFNEPWIVSESGDDRIRALVVNDSPAQLEAFAQRYGVSVEVRPMNLERVFTNVIGPLHSGGRRR